ncbi:YheC/YheD family protein [Bacillus sp. FJAT-49711]|uniref:YheC/YheD family protein n=1 Tax=Bacillus sp. FJAT-49711 TaxID=2833585 RepID=UPI001BC9F4BB|nr:YheC/YheD family protein [Bacillus sp. FJAT-49711]MBS4218431.1 YheC/YheD family protein [Bacillus sp. FJAT-49711]
MGNNLEKWKQALWLKQNSLTAKSLPETNKYSPENLIDFLNRYDYVYIKHNNSGQGKGIFKVYKRKDGRICFNGFSLLNKPVKKCMAAIKDFHKVLHPYKKLGRLEDYIIQEGIQSFTYYGLPLGFRVHVQNLKGKWIIGGMYAKIGSPDIIDSGIFNFNIGSEIISIDELFSEHLHLNDVEERRLRNNLRKVAITAAEVIALQFPCREYGIDFGLKPTGKPMIYEVNTTPGIDGFSQIEYNTLWERIVKIRKLQRKD